MIAAPFVLAAAMAAQVPNPATDCAAAMARSMTGATVQVCLAEAELSQAAAAPKETAANRSSSFRPSASSPPPASWRASPPTSAVSCGPSSLQQDFPPEPAHAVPGRPPAA